MFNVLDTALLLLLKSIDRLLISSGIFKGKRKYFLHEIWYVDTAFLLGGAELRKKNLIDETVYFHDLFLNSIEYWPCNQIK